MENEKEFPGKIEIPLSTGIEWAKRFKQLNVEKEPLINAYLIPLESLEEIVKLKKTLGIDSARAYIGINDSGEQNLMFVGAKLDPLTGVYKDVFTNQTDIGASVVYDGSRPCPPCADTQSPMN